MMSLGEKVFWSVVALSSVGAAAYGYHRFKQIRPDLYGTPQAVTLREHHSFVELPDGNYKPRRLDPRAPSFGIEFYDYASPINEPVEKRWISRHRLEKKDPTAKSYRRGYSISPDTDA